MLTGKIVSHSSNPGCVVKCGPDSFLPGMAVFKPFSGLSRSGWYNLSILPGNAVKSKIRENQGCPRFPNNQRRFFNGRK